MDSKFMQILNESIPTDDVDSKIEGKRALQHYLFEKDIRVEVKHHKDIMIITLPDGMEVKLEVISVKKNGVSEDQEDMAGKKSSASDSIAAIASLDNPKGKFKRAQKDMSNAAMKIAKKFQDAAK